MAVEYFLKIDGIPGESTDARHEGEIELESFSWGASRAGGTPGGGGGAGKVQVEDLLVTMPVSTASPALMLACATGKHHRSGTLAARVAGNGQQDFLSYTFNDLIITAYRASGTSPSDVVVDQVSLSFARLRMSYRAQRADGTWADPVETGWDVTESTSL